MKGWREGGRGREGGRERESEREIHVWLCVYFNYSKKCFTQTNVDNCGKTVAAQFRD